LLYSFKEEYYGSYSELAEQANGVAPAVEATMSGSKSSSSKSRKASSCPENTDDSCLSDDRKAELLAEFDIEITDVNANTSGYDELSDTFLQSFGYAVPDNANRLVIGGPIEKFNTGNEPNTYVIPVNLFKCIGEGIALGLSACEQNSSCTYFSLNQIYDEDGYDLQFRFYSPDSHTAQFDASDIVDGTSVNDFPDAPRATREFTVFKKTTQAAPAEFSDLSCDVPTAPFIGLAFVCSGIGNATLAQYNGGCCGANAGNDCSATVNAFNAATGNSLTQAQYCLCGSGVGGPLAPLGQGNLATDDFETYIAPIAQCLGPTNTALCLQCVVDTITDNGFGCNGRPVCEEDEDLNFITAKNCTDGIQTDGCICDGCGDVCIAPDGSSCLAQIQTGISCQLGSPADIVQDPLTGEFVNSGSCLNSKTGPGEARDFSCPSSA